jgi:hypothetical protein
MLVLLADHWLGVEEGLASVRDVRRAAPSARLKLWIARDLARRLGVGAVVRMTEIDDVRIVPPDDSLPADEDEADQIYVPVLPLSLLSAVARLDDGTPFSRAVIRGLCAGKPVAALRTGVDAGGPAWENRGLRPAAEMRRAIAELAGTVRSFGMKLLDAAQVAEWARGEPVRRPVITEADVKAALAAGRRTIAAGRNAVITPLARDFAKQHGIVWTETGWEEDGGCESGK